MEIIEKEKDWFYDLVDSDGKVFESTKKMFRTVYSQVCSRCFGITFNSACCIPFADNLNHTHTRSGVYLMNKTLHQRPLSVKGYFNRDLYLSDVRAIFSEEESEWLD
jgi:hypothetical protein